ncbi:MAG: hypothetical protein ACFFG0_03845 [Candidatus Thorarchaeota archaeon]
MYKIPCKECITFAICKQKVKSLFIVDSGTSRMWLYLYFGCSIFSKFYDYFLTRFEYGSGNEVDHELSKLYEISE